MPHRFSLPFLNFRNIIDFPLRQLFHWQRQGFELKNETKDGLFNHLPEPNRFQAQADADRLLSAYHLQALHSCSSQDNYRENLYYLEMMEKALSAVNPVLPPRVVAGDIGPSHWFYVQALYAALKWWPETAGREVSLTGFESDPYRIYSDFHSRIDHAQAHMASLPGVSFKPTAFMTQPAAFDLITMFFPFIFLPDHLEWGLPASMFDPSTLLTNAWISLKPGGLLIVANQGQAEHQKQGELFNQAHIPISAEFPFDSMFYQYDTPRFITIARREYHA